MCYQKNSCGNFKGLICLFNVQIKEKVVLLWAWNIHWLGHKMFVLNSEQLLKSFLIWND